MDKIERKTYSAKSKQPLALKEGRMLSTANVALLGDLADSLEGHAANIRDLLAQNVKARRARLEEAELRYRAIRGQKAAARGLGWTSDVRRLDKEESTARGDLTDKLGDWYRRQPGIR